MKLRETGVKIPICSLVVESFEFYYLRKHWKEFLEITPIRGKI